MFVFYMVIVLKHKDAVSITGISECCTMLSLAVLLIFYITTNNNINACSVNVIIIV